MSDDKQDDANGNGPKSPAEVLASTAAALGLDVLVYAGAINRRGYALVSEAIAHKVNDDTNPGVAFMLTTVGGDPHAGFRIARSLHHHYGGFIACVSGYCKSAGTLICLGGRQLVMSDLGELGPLDVQVRKRDELFDMGSGLDSLQAVNFLQTQAMNAFRSYLLELKAEAGLGTRIASEISSELATGLFAPIVGQMDPVKLGELNRQIAIAFAYGNRLAAKPSAKNMKLDALRRLVVDYPAHGFVIDRKEARTLFKRVRCPEPHELPFFEAAAKYLDGKEDNDEPYVRLFEFTQTNTNDAEGAVNDEPAGSDPGGDPGGEQAGDGGS